MAARVLALVAAVAMVAGALYVRGTLDDDDERSSTSLRIVCATELAAVCEALQEEDGAVEVTVEPAATTADSLTDLDAEARPALDGWLVTAPWPVIVNEARDRAGRQPFLAPGEVLARSPVALAVRSGRVDVLAAACGGEPSWRCLGDNAGKRWSDLPDGRGDWGAVKPGHPPVTTAAGLTVLGAAVVGYFAGSTDLSLTELEESGFQAWLRRLEQAQPQRDPSPFATMLQRPTAFDAVGVLEAEAGPALITARQPKPVLLYPSPVATADVVLAETGGRAGELLRRLLSGQAGRRALTAGGWRVQGENAVAGIDASLQLSRDSNLPPPGVLDALRQEAVEAAR